MQRPREKLARIVPAVCGLRQPITAPRCDRVRRLWGAGLSAFHGDMRAAGEGDSGADRSKVEQD